MSGMKMRASGARMGRRLPMGVGRRAAVAGLALSAVLAGGALTPGGPAAGLCEPVRAHLAASVALASENEGEGALSVGVHAAADAGVVLANEGAPGEGAPAPADEADAGVALAGEAVPGEGAPASEGELPAGDAGEPGGAGDVTGDAADTPDGGAGDAGASGSDGPSSDSPADPSAPTDPDAPAGSDAPSDGGEPAGPDGAPDAPDAANPDAPTPSPDATAPGADPANPSDAATLADSAQTDAADESQRTGTRFSLLDEGLLTPVRNQYGYDTCWAFAAMASLESSVLRTTGVSLELSPFQGAYFMTTGDAEWEHASNGNPYSTPSPYGGNGSPLTLAGSLAAGKGAAVVEYGVNDWGAEFDESLRYASDVRLTGTIPLYSLVPCWEEPDASSKIAVVQDLVRNVGPVTASMCSDQLDNFNAEHSCFYAPEGAGYAFNHQVVIVGWDDDYPRENFNETLRPQANGAWLIKNSWGPDQGEDGYFWVSYEDQMVPESVLMGELARAGEKTYQTDVVGWENSLSVDGGTGAYMAAAYTSERAETLDRVMFVTTGYSASYTVSVYLNPSDPTDPTSGELVTVQEGFEQTPGHHTVSLDAPVELSAGDAFSIVVRVQNASYPYPVAVEVFNPDPELGQVTPTYMLVDDEGELEQCHVSADGVSWSNPGGYGRDLALGSGSSFCVTGVSVKGLTMPREETVDPEPEPEPEPNPDARFSLLDEGLLTPVRDQGSYEMCWSFGYLSSLESSVLRATGTSLELSPFQSSYFMMVGDDEAEHATNGNPYATVDPYAGVGPTYWLTGSLAAGKGAAAVESGVNDWGNPSFDESLRYESAARLTDAPMLYDSVAPFWEEPSEAERTQVIKDLVRNVGPVVAKIYGHMDGDVYSYEHGSWRVPQDGGYHVDHLVSIVGWDDTYPRENFVTQPGSDGAWLIKNSWGTGYGNDGYFWLSYDSLFEAQTVLVGELAREGERTYQFDEVGWMDSMTLGGTDAFMANVFTSGRAETLDRAMFVTTGRNTAYTVSVYRNPADASDPLSGELVSMTKGVQQWPGYHTVSLDAPVELSAGDTFALVVHVQNESYAYPIAVETFSPDPELPGAVPSHMGLDAAGNPEVSLVSTDGVSWENPAGYGRELAMQGGDRSYVTNVSVKGLAMPREEVVDPEPEPDPDPDPDPTPDPDPDPAPDPDPEPEPEPEPDPDPNPDPDPEPDPDDPTPSPNPDPTPTPDPSPQPDPTPGTNPGTGDKVPGGEGSKPGAGKDELPQTGDATSDALPVALGVTGAGVLAGAGAAALASARRKQDA